MCAVRGALQNDERPRLVFGRDQQNQTVLYFPDKLPIGIDHEAERHVFMFLAADGSPMDCCQFLLRHAELLRTLRSWKIPRSAAARTGSPAKHLRGRCLRPARASAAAVVPP